MSDTNSKFTKVISSIGDAPIVSKLKVKHLVLIGLLVVAYSLFTGNEYSDGVWYASVYYTNLQTGEKSKYGLSVRIKNDHVVLISFPKAGSIHSGPNNSGYTYSGGKLKKNQGGLPGAEVILTNAGGSRFRYFVVPTYFGYK